MVTKLVSSYCRVESHCKESSISDTNWLKHWGFIRSWDPGTGTHLLWVTVCTFYQVRSQVQDKYKIKIKTNGNCFSPLASSNYILLFIKTNILVSGLLKDFLSKAINFKVWSHQSSNQNLPFLTLLHNISMWHFMQPKAHGLKWWQI